MSKEDSEWMRWSSVISSKAVMHVSVRRLIKDKKYPLRPSVNNVQLKAQSNAVNTHLFLGKQSDMPY